MTNGEMGKISLQDVRLIVFNASLFEAGAMYNKLLRRKIIKNYFLFRNKTFFFLKVTQSG